MSKFIRLLTFTLALVCTFISCKKDEDVVYGGKPYNLDGTTWTSSMSEDGEYTSFHFLSGMQYEKRILDKNAVLTEVELKGRYDIVKYEGRWRVRLYRGNDPRYAMYVDFDKGVMTDQGEEYRKQ
ncbi:MAG: hypothetical protein ACFN22_01435 [Porphyromonas pasteri]|jgi:lipoprotein